MSLCNQTPPTPPRSDCSQDTVCGKQALKQSSLRTQCSTFTASIVSGPLVQPSQDPETGLDIFPRLPELDEDPTEVFQSELAPSAAVNTLMGIYEISPPDIKEEREVMIEVDHSMHHKQQQRKQQLTSPSLISTSNTTTSGWSLAKFFHPRTWRSFSTSAGSDPSLLTLRSITPVRPKTSTSTSTSAAAAAGESGNQVWRPSSASRDGPQPVARKQGRYGGHVYCRHTLDSDCRCEAILTLSQGDYCDACWAGRCPGWVPYHRYPPPTPPWAGRLERDHPSRTTHRS